MIAFLYAILFHFHLHQAFTSFLNKDEISISIELIKALEIRQCIIVGATKNEDIQKFSSINVPITHLTYNQLIRYVIGTEIVYHYTGLLFKEENLKILEKTVEFFWKSKKTYKLQNFVWLVFLGHHELKKIIIPYDCEFLAIQPKRSITYAITEIYTVKKKFFSLKFGTWTRDFGLQTSNLSFYRRRFDFQGSELKVIFEKDDLYSPDTVRVYMNELFNGLAYRLNLTVRRDVKKSKNEARGAFYAFGDIFAYPILFDFKHMLQDSLGPIYKRTIKWYIKHPTVQLMSDYYLQPFSTSLWLVLLSAILLETVLVLITQSLIPREKRALTDNLYLGLESFCGQCGNDDMENSSLRLICISLSFTALFLIGSYGAIITSYFAVEIFKPPFTNLKGFVADGEYQLLKPIPKNPFFDNFLSKTVGLENLTTFIPFNDYQEYGENTCRGKYAVYFLGFLDIGDLDLSCKIYEIPEHLVSILYGMAIQKNSSFTRIISKNLIRFIEIGIQMRCKLMEKNTKSDIIAEDDSFRPIKMDQMTQVVSIPFFGILLGTAIMLMEIGISKSYASVITQNFTFSSRGF